MYDIQVIQIVETSVQNCFNWRANMSVNIYLTIYNLSKD